MVEKPPLNISGWRCYDGAYSARPKLCSNREKFKIASMRGACLAVKARPRPHCGTARHNIMQGIGVDIIELNRIQNIRFLERFSQFILSENEMRQMHSASHRAQFVASRLAVKEAVIKALPGSLKYHDFEIIKKGRKPVVRFLKPITKPYKTFISLAHSSEYVVGFALVV